ncbi:hypothetical protein M9H77_15849 [Catharanthus roseus]|uniref:Uncharacterized protein n=1 Tax=Catharanthus roseus TaxID=4058 RepID=A0ACC0AZ08_CATRO|nr:hypothetical protein M9H77_15849 [Catharanthus roseus]
MDTFNNSMMGFNLNSHSNLPSSERNLANGCGQGNLENFDAEEESSLPRDHFDSVLKYLNQMLMEEEDLEQRPCMYQDLLALQAAEKSFYDALKGQDHSSTFGNQESKEGASIVSRNPKNSIFSSDPMMGSSWMINGVRYREDDEEIEDRRISKQFASYTEEFDYDPIDMYDKVLLCPCNEKGRNNQHIVLPQEPKRGRPKAGEKKPNIREVVDLRSLLTQCAESVAVYDNRTSHELLNKIRQHSSPYGDATERLAHCFANALEARISGMGTTLYTAISTRRVSAAESLKAYHSYVLACPFQRMSNIFADKSIGKLTRGASTVHIIDFGILYGFQWPCIIQGMSLRPEGPPKLIITGIDLPQPGFRPAERVEETGRRLERYCKRFNVPFQYYAIAKKWETISLEDLKIEKGETVVVNCLYRLRHVLDETAESGSPRDAVLNLIKKINPDYFIHGIINGSYNSPFFVTRFRDALYHFSSLFDMFDKTLSREDQDRFLFEKEVIGRDAMNVIACEGTERVERPETYKQWQMRNQRAGFTQLPLIQDIVNEVRAKVRMCYHKDFLVDEDRNWMLQGWKGRVIYAISCWKPTKNR